VAAAASWGYLAKHRRLADADQNLLHSGPSGQVADQVRLDHSSVRWVSVHVAIPANVHSNNTADNASPVRTASPWCPVGRQNEHRGLVVSNVGTPLGVRTIREWASDVDLITSAAISVSYSESIGILEMICPPV